MKMLLGTILCSFLLLASARDFGIRNHDGDGRTYTYSERHVSNGGRDVTNVDSSYTDNSIHRDGANFKGASNVFIGSNANVLDEDTLPQMKRSVDTATESLSRQKRWGIGFKSGVHNSHSTHTDNSIHANNADFGNSQNVVIGHGNRLSKRDTYNQVNDNSIKIKDFYVHGSAAINIGHQNRYKKDVEQVEAKAAGEEELSRQKRWGIGFKSGVKNSHSTHTDNSIHLNNANFGSSQGVVIGHGNHLSKRSVDAATQTEEVPRQKRWSFKLKSNVENSHSTHTDNSIHMNHADFSGSSNVVVGHGNHLSKRSVDPTAEPVESTAQPTAQEDAERTRVKRKFFGSVAIHDMRTRPGPPVSLENLEGSGSVHIVIYDNTDPVTLRGAKITGAAHLIVQ